MQLEIDTTVEGKVTKITKFGAFVELENGKSGLIHISEISTGFVKQVEDYLKIGDNIKVKVLSISDDGKIELSRKKVEMEERAKSNTKVSQENQNFSSNKFEDKFRRNFYNHSTNYSQNKNGDSYFRNKSKENNRNNSVEYNSYDRRSFGGNKSNDSVAKNSTNKFEDMLMKFKKLSDEKLAGFEKTKSRRGRNSHKDSAI